MSRRWMVERPNGAFDDVGANLMAIALGGALQFTHEGKIVVAYSPTSWVAVTEEDDA